MVSLQFGSYGGEVAAYIRDTTVDVPELLEPEQAGGMGAVIEDKAGCGIYGHRSGICSGIRFLPAIDISGMVSHL